MKEIILVGGGGHCKSVIDVIEKQNLYKIAGIVDKKELIGSKVLDYEIIGCDDDLEDLRKKISHAIVTVGHIKSNNTRVKLFNLLKKLDFHMPSIVSPLAYVSKHAFVDEGSVVMHHALINADVKIGKNCIVNSKALVEHDVIVEDNVHLSTSSVVNGGVTVKENTFIGSNAVVKEYIQVSGFVKAGELIK